MKTTLFILSFAIFLSCKKKEAKTYYTDPPETYTVITVGSGGSAPNLNDPWTSVDDPIKFFKDKNGNVHLTGSPRMSGVVTGNDVLFRFPTGYIPKKDKIFTCLVYDSGYYITSFFIVGIDGDVTFYSPALSGSSFTVVYFGDVSFYTGW